MSLALLSLCISTMYYQCSDCNLTIIVLKMIRSIKYRVHTSHSFRNEPKSIQYIPLCTINRVLHDKPHSSSYPSFSNISLIFQHIPHFLTSPSLSDISLTFSHICHFPLYLLFSIVSLIFHYIPHFLSYPSLSVVSLTFCHIPRFLSYPSLSIISLVSHHIPHFLLYPSFLDIMFHKLDCGLSTCLQVFNNTVSIMVLSLFIQNLLRTQWSLTKAQDVHKLS